MTRFTLAAALAVVIGVGFAGKADAQYVYRYTTPTPGGGLYTTNQIYTPFGAQAQNIYVSPFGAVQRSQFYSDPFGNNYGRAYGFNPYNGAMYNRGYGYNSFVPFSGYNYGYYRRW